MSNNPFANAVTLDHALASLQPLSHEHLQDLQAATDDGDLHKLWFTTVPTALGMSDEIDRRLRLQADGSMNPFAVICNAPGPLQGKAVGMTTYMNIDAANRRVEIGSTWYRAAVQRSAVNTVCKRLLLAYAFETLDCIAVEFRTHFMNHASRKGIERLGAKLDGVLRNHMLMHNDAHTTMRDTCVYSITASEWPAVKAHLDFQLSKPR
ncbi:GNAT family N-acetyltransferase [Comamonadaceae bacterium M7527]|nr:GNAT family N-acetyltransferase [Comamonadaceae bacterium M7527]